MLKRHADIIVSHLSELASNTNVAELAPRLVLNNVFSKDMIERILAESPSPKLQAVSIYLAIQKRGPTAFDSLITSLLESSHINLAQTLRRANLDTMYQGDALPLSEASRSATSDSPDSSPTRHHVCQFPQSIHPFNLPNYIDGVKNVRRAVPCEDDFVEFFGFLENGPVSVRSSDTLRASPDGTLPEKYKMTSKPRGYVLIINNISFDNYEEYPFRNGARNDEEALKSLFEQLYFEVELHQNKTRAEMVQLVEDFSAKDAWSLVDCAFVIFMSHGREGQSEEDTEILGVDGTGFKTKDIISYFYNDSCPRLIDKPKVFIFQSCRGTLTDNGVEIEYNNYAASNILAHRTETDGRVTRSVFRDRTQSDIFIIHPVPPGIKANRDRFSGTWFIQMLVQIISQYAHDSDLEDILKIVDQKIKKTINMVRPSNYQTVTTQSIGWNKKLFFNPGLHTEGGRVIRKVSQEDQGMDVVDTPSECQMKGLKEDRVRLKFEDDDETSKCYSCWPC